MPKSSLRTKPGRSIEASVLDDVTKAVNSLTGLAVDELRAIWRQRWRHPFPKGRSADTLRRLIAWKVQAEAYGDLDRETLERLSELTRRLARGAPATPDRRDRLTVGTLFSRDWRGRTHEVTVVAEGFAYAGRTYASLSEVARAITGTRWSGPRFFGLEERDTGSAAAARGTVARSGEAR